MRKFHVLFCIPHIECLAHLLICSFLSMNLQLLGQLQKNTTRAVFPPCPNAVCRNPFHFKVILSHFDFHFGALGCPGWPLRCPGWPRSPEKVSKSVFYSFGIPFGDPRGVLWEAFSVLVATRRAQESKKTTHRRMSSREPDFSWNLLLFSGAVDS